jgi:hypothetical protein
VMSTLVHTLHVILAGAWLGGVVFTTAVVSPAFIASNTTFRPPPPLRSVIELRRPSRRSFSSRKRAASTSSRRPAAGRAGASRTPDAVDLPSHNLLCLPAWLYPDPLQNVAASVDSAER